VGNLSYYYQEAQSHDSLRIIKRKKEKREIKEERVEMRKRNSHSGSPSVSESMPL
jgi:hypothetical protein